MTEPMIQVPVSLIEDTATVLDRAGYHGTAERLRDALLSQPAPTAEPTPGTTFTAPAPSELWRWAVRSDSLVVSAAGVWPLSSIDPSTIRDMTPPA